MPRDHNLLTDRTRIEALRQSGLLDSPQERLFDGITTLATSLLEVPIVLITLVDTQRQFFKSSTGLPEPWKSRRETPLSHSLCQHVVQSGAPLVVADAREHPVVRDNLAIPEMGVIAYAGIPIVTAQGHRLGSLAAIDTLPRAWTDRDVRTLEHLAHLVAQEIDLRISARVSEEREREARGALEAAQEEVSGLLERISDAFVALDLGGRFTYVNEKAGELLARSPQSLIGKHVWSEFAEGVGPAFRDAYRRAAESKQPQTIEEFYPPTGHWYETRIYPSPQGAAVFFTNVTDRKLAEVRIRESEALFRELAEGIPQAVWLTDVGGKAVYISPAFERIWGRTADEVVRDPSLVLADVHPDDRERTGQSFDAIAQGEPLHVEFRIVMPGGDIRWLSTRGVPISGDDGEVVRVAGLTDDITGRKRAEQERERLLASEREAREQLEGQAVELELAVSALQDANEALRESEQRYRRLFESVGEGYCVVQVIFQDETPVDYRFLEANPAFENQTGLRTAVGKTIRELVPDLEDHWFQTYGRVALTGEVARFESGSDVMQRWFEVFAFRVEEPESRKVAIRFTDITERKQTEIALQQSEERFHTVFDQAAVGIVLTALDGVPVALNPAFRQMVGYAAEELMAMRLSEITHPDDRKREAALFEELVTGALPFVRCEKRYLRKDGGVVWADVSGSVLYGTAQEPIALVAVIQDITEQKRAETALRESEERLRLTVAAAGLGIWEHDIVGGRIHLDGPAQDLYCLGATPSLEEIGQRIHPDDRERLSREAGSASDRADRASMSTDFRILLPDRSVRWLRAKGKVEFADGGAGAHPVRGLGTVQDVTEEKRAEDALRESESRYRRFFEDDLTGDYIARADGTIVECNRAFVQIFGFGDVEEAKCTRITALFEDPSRYDRIVRELHERGRLEIVEMTLRRRDGKAVDIVGNLVGSFDESGELIEINGYLFDVTERNALEAQLAQSQKMEVVGRLAGGIAHDFNNMLTAIMGNAQILLDSAHDDAELRGGLLEIEHAAERSAGLTRQLLAFSRKQVLQPRAVDLNRTITQMENMLRRLIGEHIVVTMRLLPELGEVYVDPSQMEQVIMNLVVNARDAMPRGGELTIKTAVADRREGTALAVGTDRAGGRYAVLSIRDTGHGMDDDTKARIFEPFFTTKPVGQGTGLGLSTVYGIVKQSGGEIHVESDDGRGSTFVVFLPLLEDASVAREDPVGPARAARGTETVLLVEDDASVRDLIRRVLQHSGYTVLDAASGVQAIRLAEEWDGPVGLILSDVVMPGMSGQDVVEALRERLPGVPVLFMSGYIEDTVLQRDVLEPGTHFVEKPFTPDTLRHKVRNVLDRVVE